MVNLNGTTPQLKAAKRVVDAYSSRDLTNSGSVFSKDFKFQSFPKASEHVQETKGGHFQKYDPIFGSFAKMENHFHEVIEAPGKVVLHTTAVWTTPDGNSFDYDTLLVMSFVEEDGELKVCEIKDFSDAEKRKAFHAAAAKSQAKGGLAA